jgi:site-specific DNA recombinase
MAKQKLEKNASTNAAIYARVSTDEQAHSGLGIDAQIAACRQLAAVRGWDVADEHIYVDAGVSGTVSASNRPAMARLLRDAEEGAFGTVVIFSLDRLARKTTYILSFVESLTDGDIGVTFYREQAVDTTTAAGRVVLGVLGAFAQFERDLISERTRDALEQKRERGWRAGRLPYGYVQDEDFSLFIDEEKAAVVCRIFQGRADGTSYGKLAKALNADGIPAPHGKKWYASGIREIVVNNEAAYRGEDGFPPIL